MGALMTKNRILISVIMVLAFLLGYTVRGIIGSPHNLINSSEPPMPSIQINGQNIPVYQGSYTWCSSITSLAFGSCKSVDMVAPADIIKQKGVKPPTVSPSSVIDTKAPKGIKEFTLTRVGNKENNSDPYRIPSEKGIYLYNIHCVWFADQGNGDFFFELEVQ